MTSEKNKCIIMNKFKRNLIKRRVVKYFEQRELRCGERSGRVFNEHGLFLGDFDIRYLRVLPLQS